MNSRIGSKWLIITVLKTHNTHIDYMFGSFGIVYKQDSFQINMAINHSTPIYKCPCTYIGGTVYLGSQLEALQSIRNDRIELKQFSPSWVLNEPHALNWVSWFKLLVSLCDRFGVITAASLGISPFGFRPEVSSWLYANWVWLRLLLVLTWVLFRLAKWPTRTCQISPSGGLLWEYWF